MSLTIRLSLIALFALIAACTNDVIGSSHASLASAAPDIERGWIPPILPVSAVDIRETHNIDTNVGHGTFSFGPAGAAQFKTALSPLPAGQALLRPNVPRQEFERQGYAFYRYSYFDIAVDWQAGRGQFWLVYSR